jgi:hypothetical protein
VPERDVKDGDLRFKLISHAMAPKGLRKDVIETEDESGDEEDEESHEAARATRPTAKRNRSAPSCAVIASLKRPPSKRRIVGSFSALCPDQDSGLCAHGSLRGS